VLPSLVWAIVNGNPALPQGSASQILQLVALGALERVSSISHFSWGILAVVAAFSKKTKYLIVAFPMGFIDFLVPFASSMSLLKFELIVFSLSVLSLLATYALTKDDWPMVWRDRAVSQLTTKSVGSPTSGLSDLTSPPSLGNPVSNVKCSKCGTVFEADWNPFLPHLGSAILRRCPFCQKLSFMNSNVDEPLTQHM